MIHSLNDICIVCRPYEFILRLGALYSGSLVINIFDLFLLTYHPFNRFLFQNVKSIQFFLFCSVIRLLLLLNHLSSLDFPITNHEWILLSVILVQTKTLLLTCFSPLNFNIISGSSLKSNPVLSELKMFSSSKRLLMNILSHSSQSVIYNSQINIIASPLLFLNTTLWPCLNFQANHHNIYFGSLPFK